jgi:8-oxo-dGTP pyrophosphatase MutT (NUDIX family)
MKKVSLQYVDIVSAVVPHDELEKVHIEDTLQWIRSGVPVVRSQSPDRHLVSYFVLFDPKHHKLLLIDHIKAGLWLPTGGHVEADEDAQTTVVREAREELQHEASFDTVFGDEPVFVTVTQTRGAGTHTDVSLWYVISGDSEHKLDYDPREMNGYKWMGLQEVLDTDQRQLDPHMHRFVRKMHRILKETQ